MRNARTTDGDVREQSRDAVPSERLLGALQANVTPPKPKEISEFYKRNQRAFHDSRADPGAHIVKNIDEQNDEASARAGIDAALSELRDGARFDRSRRSPFRLRRQWRRSGLVSSGEMVEEFDEIVFKLPVGAQSEIFPFPFRLPYRDCVLERKPAGITAIEGSGGRNR